MPAGRWNVSARNGILRNMLHNENITTVAWIVAWTTRGYDGSFTVPAELAKEARDAGLIERGHKPGRSIYVETAAGAPVPYRFTEKAEPLVRDVLSTLNDIPC